MKKIARNILLAGFGTLLTFIGAMFFMETLSHGQCVALWFGVIFFCISLWGAVITTDIK